MMEGPTGVPFVTGPNTAPADDTSVILPIISDTAKRFVCQEDYWPKLCETAKGFVA